MCSIQLTFSIRTRAIFWAKRQLCWIYLQNTYASRTARALSTLRLRMLRSAGAGSTCLVIFAAYKAGLPRQSADFLVIAGIMREKTVCRVKGSPVKNPPSYAISRLLMQKAASLCEKPVFAKKTGPQKCGSVLNSTLISDYSMVVPSVT